MAKDPAILFYTSDFLTGTMLMTNEQKGIYITLLCVQHQHNGRIEKSSFEAMANGHELILSKFKTDGKGYYNIRLAEESKKRRLYSESRSKNRRNKTKDMKNISKTYVPHMENENENANRDVVVSNKSKPKDINEVIEYANSIGFVINAEEFIDHYEANGWFRGKTKIKDWKACVRTWKNNHKDKPKQNLTAAQKRTLESHAKWDKRMKDEERNT